MNFADEESLLINIRDAETKIFESYCVFASDNYLMMVLEMKGGVLVKFPVDVDTALRLGDALVRAADAVKAGLTRVEESGG